MGGSIFLHAPFGGQEGVEEERGALGPQECVVVAPTSTGAHAEMLAWPMGPHTGPLYLPNHSDSSLSLSMALGAHCPPVGPTLPSIQRSLLLPHPPSGPHHPQRYRAMGLLCRFGWDLGASAPSLTHFESGPQWKKK